MHTVDDFRISLIFTVCRQHKQRRELFLSVGCWIITESTKMVFFVFDILCKLHKESYPFDSEHEKKNPLTRINMFLCVCVWCTSKPLT